MTKPSLWRDRSLVLPMAKYPPGYKERIPPVPLVPERLYTVQILPKGVTPTSWVYFIIRADSTGRLTQLEASHDGPA